jgi:large conductance mechanosensitive channel
MVAILKGFRDFLLKGDLITTAVGLAMGLVTVALAESLVENLITPIVAAIFGTPDFADLHFTINGSVFKYGAFINALVVFVGTAVAIYFFIIVPYQRYQELKGRFRQDPPLPRMHHLDLDRRATLPGLHRGGRAGRRLSDGKIRCSRAFPFGKGGSCRSLWDESRRPSHSAGRCNRRRAPCRRDWLRRLRVLERHHHRFDRGGGSGEARTEAGRDRQGHRRLAAADGPGERGRVRTAEGE